VPLDFSDPPPRRLGRVKPEPADLRADFPRSEVRLGLRTLGGHGLRCDDRDLERITFYRQQIGGEGSKQLGRFATLSDNEVERIGSVLRAKQDYTLTREAHPTEVTVYRDMSSMSTEIVVVDGKLYDRAVITDEQLYASNLSPEDVFREVSDMLIRQMMEAEKQYLAEKMSSDARKFVAF
jgi:hypothetical protein